MSRVGKYLTNIWSENRLQQSIQPTADIKDIDSTYRNYEPYSLGVYYGEDLVRRDRKSIYTEYKMMMQILINRYGSDNATKDIARFYYSYEYSE